MTAFDPLTSPVDVLELAGQRSPGRCVVKGWSSPRRYDERRGYGLSGATIVFRGIQLARGQFVLTLSTAEDFSEWDTWKAIIDRPPAGERPRALDVVHPILEGLGVRSVVIENVEQPEQTGDGEWTVVIHAVEYRRPQIALARPDGSTARSTDPVDQYIEQLTGQVQALAAE